MALEWSPPPIRTMVMLCWQQYRTELMTTRLTKL
jgi:hypothetical protein